jgi:hypothetical protein
VNCEKITYYIEKGFLTDLKLSEKLQIKLHTMMCKCCKNYAPDSDAVNKMLSLIKEEDSTASLTDDEKQNLKDALQKFSNS